MGYYIIGAQTPPTLDLEWLADRAIRFNPCGLGGAPDHVPLTNRNLHFGTGNKRPDLDQSDPAPTLSLRPIGVPGELFHIGANAPRLNPAVPSAGSFSFVMAGMRQVEYFMDKAREADRLAEAEEDPALKQDWLKIEAFWIGAAERALSETAGRPGFFPQVLDLRRG